MSAPGDRPGGTDSAHRPPRPPRLTVTVCRDCCCGNPARHPHVDHEGHRARLAAAAGAVGARLHTSRCLGLCSFADVVRVRVTDRHGVVRTHWLGLLLEDEVVDQLGTWIEAGAPAPLPPDLDRRELGRHPAGGARREDSAAP